MYIADDKRSACVLEVNSDTDFVARNVKFQNLVCELATTASVACLDTMDYAGGRRAASCSTCCNQYSSQCCCRSARKLFLSLDVQTFVKSWRGSIDMLGVLWHVQVTRMSQQIHQWVSSSLPTTSQGRVVVKATHVFEGNGLHLGCDARGSGRSSIQVAYAMHCSGIL